MAVNVMEHCRLETRGAGPFRVFHIWILSGMATEVQATKLMLAALQMGMRWWEALGGEES